jgi:hypothetical protein
MVAVNIILVLIEMGYGIYIQVLTKYAIYKWKKFYELQDKMAEFIVLNTGPKKIKS